MMKPQLFSINEVGNGPDFWDLKWATQVVCVHSPLKAIFTEYSKCPKETPIKSMLSCNLSRMVYVLLILPYMYIITIVTVQRLKIVL